jgi:hypothetical protein
MEAGEFESWICMSCKQENYEMVSRCVGCGFPNHLIKQKKGVSTNQEWICRACNNKNFQISKRCFYCNFPYYPKKETKKTEV